MTGRKFREGTRGLAGLAQVAAEILEGYFNSQGAPPEKCGVLTPSMAPQPIAPELGKEPK